jgi:hypothetical protein
VCRRLRIHDASRHEVEIVNELILHSAVRTVAIAGGRTSRRAFARCLAATVVLTATRTILAQDALIAARDLYRAAAYEEALVRLDNLRGAGRVADEGRFIEQYRAFCLLALGRTAEAERAMEAVVTAAPSFRPSDADESPRVNSVFREVRRRMLPGIIHQQYAQSKAAFDRHDSVSARAGFQRVLDLLADADIASVVNQPPLSELRTLASGFRDLSARAVPRPSPVPLMPQKSSAAALPAAVPSIRHAPAPQHLTERIYSIQDASVIPPIVVRESWAALAGVFAVRTGTIEIVIDETGTVAAAAMTTAVNAVYDRLALTEAKRWRYKPATLDAVPVKFRKVIKLDLNATR